MATITVNGNTIRPEAADVISDDAGDSNFIYIQGFDDLTVDQKEELASLHVQIQEYVAEFTYLCRFEPDSLDRIRGLTYIRAANVYHPELKPTALLKDLVRTEDQRSEYEVDIILHENPNVTPETLAPYVADKTGVSVEDMEICANKIRLVVQQDSLNDIAALDSVNRIEEVRPKGVYSNYARQILHADTLSLSTSYRGDGQLICVADTGFDQGKTDNSMHPAFSGRVKSLQSFWEDDARDPVGHGTHVCGCVCGDGTFTGFPDEPVAIKGTAPAAKLMVQAMSKEDKKRNFWGFKAPANLDKLFREPYEIGGRIHNNSWGDTWDSKVGQLDYNDDATAIDRFIHEKQDFVVLLAAGNDAQEINAGSSQIGDNSAAKNAITVGATGTTRPNMFSLESDADAEIHGKAAAVATADFSSRGPTKSTKNTNGEEVLGRIKPDVVAPGVSIMSAASRATTSAHRIKINRRNGGTDDDDWFFMSGTSMATPLVAGCAALIREAMGEIGKNHPSAALVKALLVNGAGFGRVDINQSVSMVTNRTFVEGGSQLEATKWDVAPLRQVAGDDRWKSADIALPSGKLRLVATLAYSDPPGGLLQNNINLIVKVGSEERHGNMGRDSGFDNTNNVEKVIWDNPPGSTATIEAWVSGITGLGGEQSFAVVWDIQSL